MYRTHADYHHRPYRNKISGSDIFFECAKCYIVLFTVLHLSCWLTNQSVFQFKKIIVTGAHAVVVSDIEKVATAPFENRILHFWNRNNIVLYPRRDVENKIKGYDSRLASVKVSLSKNYININIDEYEPKIRYCLSPLSREDANTLVLPIDENTNATSSASSTSEIAGAVDVPREGQRELGLKEIPVPELIDGNSHNCFWADDKGYIFAVAPTYSGLPLFTVTEKDPAKSITLLSDNSPIGKNILESKSFENLNGILSLLKNSGINVRQALNLSNDDITLDVGFPFMVTMNLAREPEDSVDHLLLSLKELNISATSSESKVKYIDVRFGNKVFYR